MNYKNCVIVSLCPIPNFIILFYYLISIKIMMETQKVEECQNIFDYNIISFIFVIISNLYLVSQLCYEKPQIFYNQLDGHFIFQVLWYSMLSILIVLGITFLVDFTKCRDESTNIYNLAISNTICQLIIWILTNVIVIYYSQVRNRVSPISDVESNMGNHRLAVII